MNVYQPNHHYCLDFWEPWLSLHPDLPGSSVVRCHFSHEECTRCAGFSLFVDENICKTIDCAGDDAASRVCSPTDFELERIFAYMREHDLAALQPESLGLELRLSHASVRIVDRRYAVTTEVHCSEAGELGLMTNEEKLLTEKYLEFGEMLPEERIYCTLHGPDWPDFLDHKAWLLELFPDHLPALFAYMVAHDIPALVPDSLTKPFRVEVMLIQAGVRIIERTGVRP